MFILPFMMVAGGLAVVVFVVSLPFVLKTGRAPNRFGAASGTNSIGEAIFLGFRKTFDFSDRANPMDFWYFAVFIGLACAVTVILTVFLILARHEDPLWEASLLLLILPLLAVPSLSMAVRRLHDINLSGWWLLLLGVFGYFVLLFWFCQPSQSEEELARVF